MKFQGSADWSRREFISGLALTGTAAMLGWKPGIGMAAAEPPPETTRLRLLQVRTACWAPQYVAEPLLREEGFTDVQYVKGKGGKDYLDKVTSGELDLNMVFSARHISLMDKSDVPTVFLSGLHGGCYALIGSERVNTVRDLKGKTVWVGPYEGAGPHLFFSTIVAYVGLDPRKDINYAWVSKAESMKLYKEGKIDGFMSFPPEPQELLAKNVGHLLVDTNVDRPWSQYFCCMIVGNTDFVKKNPVATKRALRAILKANDICARDPELAMQALLDHKVREIKEKEYMLKSLSEIPYGKWREYNPEETIRFYTLRLRDNGMIKTGPEEFIAKHTDWSHLQAMKQELALKW